MKKHHKYILIVSSIIILLIWIISFFWKDINKVIWSFNQNNNQWYASIDFLKNQQWISSYSNIEINTSVWTATFS